MIGHIIIEFDKVSSTNDIAKEFIEHEDSDGLVIIAKKQTKGRGRFNRKWFSLDDKGLYFSLILKRNFSFKKSILPFVVGIAIVNTLHKIAPSIKPFIKWPNDIVVNGKKICGILIENFKNGCIVGIGFNLNNDVQNFPEEIRFKATSLYNETKALYDKKNFLDILFFELENILKLDYSEQIISAVRSNLLFLGENISIQIKDENINGKLLDINNDGLLLIEQSDGRIKYIASGDIFDGNERC